MRKIIRSLLMLIPVWAGALWLIDLAASAAGQPPRVEFDAEKIQPRSIEDLTAKSVPRDYALAWQAMEQALEQNRSDLLDAYWIGFAKQDLASRIKTQIQSNVHVRYQDGGHKLQAIFYAPAGDAIELRDQVQGELEIFDGDKVVYQEPLSLNYVALMTPGADRWLVRDLQAVPQQRP